MKFMFSVSNTTKRLQLVYNKTTKIDDPKYNICGILVSRCLQK